MQHSRYKNPLQRTQNNHLATFFAGCRFDRWAGLTMDRLVREPGEVLL